MDPLLPALRTMHVAGAYAYEAATVDTKSYTQTTDIPVPFVVLETLKCAASEMLIDELAALYGADPIDFR